MPGAPTAAQTALFLRKLERGPLTEPAFRLLAEVVQGWRRVHPEIAPEHEEFRSAYQNWWPGHPEKGSPENWLQVVITARPLAKVISKYGEELLPGDGWGH